ncbi:hypothetical protein ACTXT7_005781 [Hymenolepis weldensis]
MDKDGAARQTLLEAHYVKNQCLGPQRRHYGQRIHKSGVFAVGGLACARDFQTSHSWTPRNVIKLRGKFIFEIQVSDAIWIRPRIAGTKSTPASSSLYLLMDTFEISANKSDKVHDRNSEQQAYCSKRTQKSPEEFM